jgi:hypothetical protein
MASSVGAITCTQVGRPRYDRWLAHDQGESGTSFNQGVYLHLAGTALRTWKSSRRSVSKVAWAVAAAVVLPLLAWAD